jgi:hypothetical protein
VKQMIPAAVLTRILADPRIYVEQYSGQNAWAEVNEDGSLTLDMTGAPWSVAIARKES